MLLRCTLAAARWGLMGVVIGGPWCHKRLGLPTRMFYVWNMQYGSKFIPNNGRNVGKYDIRSIEVSSKPFFLGSIYNFDLAHTHVTNKNTRNFTCQKMDLTNRFLRKWPLNSKDYGKRFVKMVGYGMNFPIIATYRMEKTNFTIKTKKN